MNFSSSTLLFVHRLWLITHIFILILIFYLIVLWYILSFYEPSILYGVEPNDIGMGNDNDENVGVDDTDMHLQPSYLDFSSYFMTNEVYFLIFIDLCFVKPCVLLLNNFFYSFRFLKRVMIC